MVHFLSFRVPLVPRISRGNFFSRVFLSRSLDGLSERGTSRSLTFPHFLHQSSEKLAGTIITTILPHLTLFFRRIWKTIIYMYDDGIQRHNFKRQETVCQQAVVFLSLKYLSNRLRCCIKCLQRFYQRRLKKITI